MQLLLAMVFASEEGGGEVGSRHAWQSPLGALWLGSFELEAVSINWGSFFVGFLMRRALPFGVYVC